MSKEVKFDFDAEKKAIEAEWQLLEDERQKLLAEAKANQARQSQLRDQQLQLRGAFQRLEALAKEPEVKEVVVGKEKKDGKK